MKLTKQRLKEIIKEELSNILKEGLSKEEAFEAHAPAHFKAMARNKPSIIDMWYSAWAGAQEDEGRATGSGPDPEDLDDPDVPRYGE
jgi:hypothetical protein|tara:strand:+ start:483 stop:743 length:261 start_codon:yes stop_codon:yes gene_type:complete